MTSRVPFLSLTPGPDAAAIAQGIERVIERGWFILGPEVSAFEEEFAAASGARFAVGVGTGTDALALTLRALGIGAGDEVITAPLSAAFSALAIVMAGATPVFADIDPARLTLDPAAVEAAITPRTRAIMPVHLYGQPADLAAIDAIAQRHALAVVEDACQAHLATAGGRPVGTIGIAGAFSFYPTKNLGALGDGGAVVTNDAAIAEKLKRLRNGGQTVQYRHDEFGVNSRLDEIQAAILRVRLAWLPRVDGEAARTGGPLPAGPRGRTGGRAAGVRSWPRLSSLPDSERRPGSAAGAPGCPGHRRARALSPPDSSATRVRASGVLAAAGRRAHREERPVASPARAHVERRRGRRDRRGP